MKGHWHSAYGQAAQRKYNCRVLSAHDCKTKGIINNQSIADYLIFDNIYGRLFLFFLNIVKAFRMFVYDEVSPT